MLTISGKVVGRKKPLFADWSVPFPPDLNEAGDQVTLRDLITRIVRSELLAFRTRQEEGRLVRALSAREIQEGAARGKVDMGGKDLQQKIDDEEAVGTALQAFADGLYLVVVDGEEQSDLDREVHIMRDSRITFLRLAMLAGG